MPPTLKDHPIKPGMLLFGVTHYFLVIGVYAEKVVVQIDTDGTKREFSDPDKCLREYKLVDDFEYVPPEWLKPGLEIDNVKIRGIHGKHVRFIEKKPGSSFYKGGFNVLPIDIFVEIHGWHGASRFDRNDPV